MTQYLTLKVDAHQRVEVLARLKSNAQSISTLSVDEHIQTSIRCAFLSDEQRCLAYEVRPGACRGHHAMDATACEVTFHDPSSTVQNQMKLSLKKCSTGYIMANEAAQGQVGMDDQKYELHTAVLEALENRASLKRLKSGKLAFPGVKDRVDPSIRKIER